MKKKLLIIGSIVGLAIVIGIMTYAIEFKKINLVSVSRNEVTSVIVTNGNNGDMIEISSEEIDSLIDLLSQIECHKISREQSSGWKYSIDIVCDNTSSKILLISDEICSIDNTYYRINNKEGDVIFSLIENFYDRY